LDGLDGGGATTVRLYFCDDVAGGAVHQAEHGAMHLGLRDQGVHLVDAGANPVAKGDRGGRVETVLEGVSVADRSTTAALPPDLAVDFIGKTPGGCSAFFVG
jgi:hypothetical protein